MVAELLKNHHKNGLSCNGTDKNSPHEQHPGIRYGLLDESHLETAVAFILDVFYAGEPMGLSLGLDVEKEVKPWIPKLIAYQLSLHICMGAWDSETGQLVGISLNELKHANTPPNVSFDSLVTAEYPTIGLITGILQELNGDRDLFAMCGVQVLGYVFIISVNSRYGQRGIANKLVELSEKVFLERNVTAVYAESTGEYSAAVFRKRGYSVKAELKYSDHKRDGEIVFKNMGVHTSCCLWVKQLRETK